LARRLAAGKRLEVKGVNGDVRAVLASGAEAVVNARKHSRRSDPDEVEIKVVESEDGITICGRLSDPPSRSRRKQLRAGGPLALEHREQRRRRRFRGASPGRRRVQRQDVNGEMSAEGLKGDAHVGTVNGSVRVTRRASPKLRP